MQNSGSTPIRLASTNTLGDEPVSLRSPGNASTQVASDADDDCRSVASSRNAPSLVTSIETLSDSGSNHIAQLDSAYLSLQRDGPLGAEDGALPAQANDDRRELTNLNVALNLLVPDTDNTGSRGAAPTPLDSWLYDRNDPWTHLDAKSVHSTDSDLLSEHLGEGDASSDDDAQWVQCSTDSAELLRDIGSWIT
ncbi:hypothetical protein LTR37_003857 [Vermiconidia calcicola]|uniref:Uncharacterized protein n=1 Tax=Vermiconidia calcicola TaxID=1690605 RepID=A0ACC3NNV2_9PEZI|nr:hypothetical protein LTR37_003857 [Vermiconidia calcicola]